jgi:voltage-dependent anion channel protein 2
VGEVKLEAKTTTPSGVVFRVGGAQDTKSNFIVGDIEAKYLNKAHGLSLTNTWTTSNTLKSLVEIDNQLAKGLKVDVNASITPDKGTKGTLLNLIYKQPGVHTRAVLDVFKVRMRVFFSVPSYVDVNPW